LYYEGTGSLTTVNYNDLLFDVHPIDQGEWLPSLLVKYNFTDKLTLRASASESLARPPFRELAPDPSYDFGSGAAEQGNPGEFLAYGDGFDPLPPGPGGLVMAKSRNLGLRLEWADSESSDLISASAFYKEVTDPIEKVFYIRLSNSSILFTYENNDNDAQIMGLEFELEKGMGFIADALEAFTIGANYTYIKAEVGRNSRFETGETDSPDIRRPGLSQTRQLQDQPTYLANAFIDFRKENWGTQLTLSYSLTSEILDTVGSDQISDLFRSEDESLNFVWQQELFAGLSFKLSAKNLLDPRYEVFYDPKHAQTFTWLGEEFSGDDTLYQSFRKGRAVSFSLKYQF